MPPLAQLIEHFLDPARQQAVSGAIGRLLSGAVHLLDSTSLLAGEIDPAMILEQITTQARDALGCERASLYLYDPERRELYTSVVTKLEINEIRRSIDQGISGYCARTRLLVNVPDPAADPRWNSEFDRMTGFTTRNILAAPLIAPSDGPLLGVLQLLNRMEHPFDEVDEALITAFCQHAAVALDRARMVNELKRQQETRASLEVARDIQRGFMPSRLPSIPRYEVATWWAANEAVGGDYCDVIPLKDGRFALVIADVSGHGLGPSLLMASLRAALRAMVLEHSEPEVLLNLLGRSIHDDLKDGRFITMVLAVLNPRDNSLEFANAGHGPAVHLEAATGDFTALESTGVPLGVLDRSEYPQGWPVELATHDLIVLCTDGIVEAENSAGQPFGRARLEQLIREGAAWPVERLVRHIGSQVESHFAGDSPPDDLTILALKRLR